MDLTVLSIFVFTSMSVVSNEYLCVCNHHTQRGVYGAPSMTSPPLGFLYKDECKALAVVPNIDKHWAVIQFFHMIAYIKKDSEVDVVHCHGTIPDEDKASTIFPPTTQTPGQTKTTNMSQTVTTEKLSSSSIYTSPSPTTTTDRMSSITSTTSQSIYRQTTTTHRTTTGSIYVTQHSKTTQHVTVKPTDAHFPKGNIQLCPDNVRHGAQVNGFKLGQHKNSCYEVCNRAVSWFHANEICKGRKGHLASLSNFNENHFLHNLITQSYHGKEFWIGLNDLHHEEHFTWSSGEHVTYRHWQTDRKSSQHSQEDCVVMLGNGRWDDISCGSSSSKEFLSTTHPYVCEYGIQEGAVLIG